MRIVRRVIVPITSKETVVRVIEFISDALVEDAKKKYGKTYGFKTDIRPVGENAIESYVQFFPYKYDFIWKITRDKMGYEVALDARTPGKWRDSIFGMDEKLQRLVDTQWSALVNFFHGYLTALALSAKSLPKGGLKKARRKLKER